MTTPTVSEIRRCCPSCLAVVRLVKTSDLPVDRVVHNPACPSCGQAIPPRKD